MWIGPRNTLMDLLNGINTMRPGDGSEWVVVDMSWATIQQHFPELWVDRIHDFVAEDDSFG